MSDGPVKPAPGDKPDAPALDDIILGEEDLTVPTAAVLKAAVEAAKDATRKRSKVTLRIPDDEVSRPQNPSSATPLGGIPVLASGRAPSSPDHAAREPTVVVSGAAAPPPVPAGQPPTVAVGGAAPLQPQRIISVGPSDDTLESPAVDLQARGARIGHGSSPARASGIDAEQEAGWTPYQPMVADRMAAEIDGAKAFAWGDAREPLRKVIEDSSSSATASMRTRDGGAAGPPVSEDIPIDSHDDDDAMLATYARLPTALDSDDMRLDEGERNTDAGEAPDEIALEDLVSVESIPNAHSLHAPPPVKNSKHVTPSAPPVVPAASLMAGVAHVPGAPVVPVMPNVSSAPPLAMPPSAEPPGMGVSMTFAMAPPSAASAAPPSSAGPLPTSPSPRVSASAQALDQGPAAGTPMARRQQPVGGPFGFMPQIGALAPPPMNEAAANRKKTRPWWEDLFNDDFIRTMAKVSDGDIAREANFIEESLGCEAGATILDLACGTGRHAVELASRGYQVVGFDLSLSMLARASDEAQDQNQKINFVQGDMREMTFEETFDGVFSWNTSFGFFDEEKNAAVIAKVHRALKKGGQFLLDVVNRDSLIRSAPSLAWFEGDGCICMDEMQIDFITSRMKVKRTLMMDDGRTKEIEYSVRVYSLHELGKMLHDNGFRVAEVSGRTGTPGVFFGCESPRTLILAEKR